MSQQYQVKSVETKSGVGKNDKPYTLYLVGADGLDKSASGFQKVEVGDTIEVETVERNGYTNYNFTKVDTSTTGGAQAASEGVATTAGASDKRVLNLLVRIAEQVGVEKSDIYDVLSDKG